VIRPVLNDDGEAADTRLLETRRAFDAVADRYDGPLGNNAAIQTMRDALIREVQRRVPAGSLLLDLGCGTGIDAVSLAAQGHRVIAIDWSPAMVQRTRDRARASGLSDRISVRLLGLHELAALQPLHVDAVYSDLGALNCALEPSVLAVCESLVRPHGFVVASTMTRLCPWEIAVHLLKGDSRRAFIRASRDAVPVPLGGETVWTRYLSPREFMAAFGPGFELVSRRALLLTAPPPYMEHVWTRFPRVCRTALRIDSALGRLPILRDMGDHALIVLHRRGRPTFVPLLD
jgi:ubiquinone/menaquinone biosynthesis C-methylase UbiE